jgi:hypothetical protein
MSAKDITTKVMTSVEAEAFVVSILSENGPSTTMEVEKAASSSGRRCPDQTVLFLTKMKSKGLIRGEVSQERRGWLWSLP